MMLCKLTPAGMTLWPGERHVTSLSHSIAAGWRAVLISCDLWAGPRARGCGRGNGCLPADWSSRNVPDLRSDWKLNKGKCLSARRWWLESRPTHAWPLSWLLSFYSSVICTLCQQHLRGVWQGTVSLPSHCVIILAIMAGIILAECCRWLFALGIYCELSEGGDESYSCLMKDSEKRWARGGK